LRSTLIVVLTALMLVFSLGRCWGEENVSESAQKRWHEWRLSRTEYPFAAWSYFSRYVGDVAGYELYRDAGLNMVQAPWSQHTNAAEAGLGVLLGSWEGLHQSPYLLDAYLIRYAEPNTAVVGYMLYDEPHVDLFPLLGAAVETIYRKGPSTSLPIITLLPNWAVDWNRFKMTYSQYVRHFVDTVHPAVLLHTHYPLLADGTDRKEYYANLELFRNEAERAGIGMMGFVLVTSHMLYRVPSEADIRWQVNSLLAYGAKGIWYYNYRIGDDRFGEGLITHNEGVPTERYAIVRQINEEVQRIGKLLLSLHSTVVVHADDIIPTGTQRYEPGCLKGVETFTGEAFLIGQFKHLDEPSDDVYMMIVNKEHLPAQKPENTAVFTLTSDYKNVWAYSRASGETELLQPDDQGQYRVVLPQGHGVLLRLTP
jgi:hypothetical protein